MIDTKEKKVGPSIAAAASIQLKYFGKEPTTLTLKEIKGEIMNDYDYLPALEVAMLFMLAEGWYNQLAKEAPQLEMA